MRRPAAVLSDGGSSRAEVSMVELSSRRWIVGLGNPGRRYATTRHNAGFWVVERIGRDGFPGDAAFPPERCDCRALWTERVVTSLGEPRPVALVRPQTYMNLSGEALRDLLGQLGELPDADLRDRLIVVHDDLDLPEGALRFRSRGSAGGHRGVASVISCLGHQRFGRLKIGVGREEGVDVVDFVLESLDATAMSRFEPIVAAAVKMLSVWVECGIQTCMNRFNAASRRSDGDGADVGP